MNTFLNILVTILVAFADILMGFMVFTLFTDVLIPISKNKKGIKGMLNSIPKDDLIGISSIIVLSVIAVGLSIFMAIYYILQRGL